VRSGFFARQQDRPSGFEASECAGHGRWSGQAGRLWPGPHL